MSFIENLYLKRHIQMLQEENNNLKNLINEAFQFSRGTIHNEAMRKAVEEAARKAAERKAAEEKGGGGAGAAPPANETPYEKRVREARERKKGEAEAKAEAERRAKSRKEFDDASAWWGDQANVDAAVEWDASNPRPEFQGGANAGKSLMALKAWETKRREAIPFDDPGTTDYEEYDKKHKERNKPKNYTVTPERHPFKRDIIH